MMNQRGFPDLWLPADVRAVLQDLSKESGDLFVLRDHHGEVAAWGSPGLFAQGRGCGAEQSVSVLLPNGERGSLCVIPSADFTAVTHAWLKAGACAVASALRIGVEAQSMAAEIARAYEELSLLYSSSATLSAAEDSATACVKALGLGASLIDAEASAVYLRTSNSSHFHLAASLGSKGVWGDSVNSGAFEDHWDSLTSGVAFSSERAKSEELALVGSLMEPGVSLLCTPLRLGAPGAEKMHGWIVFCRLKDRSPFASNEVKAATALASQTATAIANARLVEERQLLLMGTIRSLASAVDAKDRYTHGHSLRVTEYALQIARQLDCSLTESKALELAGLLHDVGKIGVPDRVLAKPGALDEEEWGFMRKHPVTGAAILEAVPNLHPAVREGVRSHHERMDGRGYPDGLVGKQIPLAGRILSVADSFDAMTSDRPYRKGMEPDDAVQRMIDATGKQFDPDIMEAFLVAWTTGEIQIGPQTLAMVA